MSAPVIDPTQENLACFQWRPAAFQPRASDTPTSWAVTSGGLPIGVTINGTTGLCSGTPTTPGVYVFGLTATNGEGAGNEASFCWPVRATSSTPGASIDVVIDLIDLVPRLAGPPLIPSAASSAAAAATAPASETPVLHSAKYGSDLFYAVTFEKNEAAADLTMTNVVATLKEFDTDAVLCSSDDDEEVVSFLAEGDTYRVYLKLAGDALAAALSNYERQKGTTFLARLEFSWTATNEDAETFGPAVQHGESETVYLRLTRPQRTLP
jgi:hypothetical protein